MTDEEQPEEQPTNPLEAMGFTFATPDEVQAYMDRQTMIAQAIKARIDNALTSMDPESLAVVRMMFHQIHQQGDVSLAAYFDGKLGGILEYHHHVCPGCGGVHEGMDLASICEPGSEVPNAGTGDEPEPSDDGGTAD